MIEYLAGLFNQIFFHIRKCVRGARFLPGQAMAKRLHATPRRNVTDQRGKICFKVPMQIFEDERERFGKIG